MTRGSIREYTEAEQKNWSVVRRLVGYDRYNSRPALEALNRVYNLTRLYVNFFQPVMKLLDKTRNGAKVHKVYDTAQTPYQRLLKAGILTEAKRRELAATYHGLSYCLWISGGLYVPELPSSGSPAVPGFSIKSRA